MHPHAIAAISAARNWSSWGYWASMTYCSKRGVPLRLVTLARILEAAKQYERGLT
jgi:hypothetical protein